MSNDTTFPDLGVPEALSTVLAARGITVPTPIQQATLPDSLAGRDVLGRGRTGSGKTYAFLLPVLARLAASGGRRQPRRPRALVLAPTRELATQIHTALLPLAEPLGLTSVTVFGGVGQNPQVTALRRGVDVLVACPGRLEDLLSQGALTLDDVEVTVLDEADHMADLGFLPVVRRILDRTPAGSQRLLFSATLDAGVDVLVRRYLTKPVTHQADSAQSPISTMAHHVFHVHRDTRLDVLLDLTSAPGRKVVFTRTKHGAKKLAKQLNTSGVPAVELHGNLGQGARDRNLQAFHEGRASTLVATDIAARGIHVDDVALVIHADPPVEHKAYLHRSGRTARAGADGTVITLMTDDQVADVRSLTSKAGIRATTTRLGPGTRCSPRWPRGSASPPVRWSSRPTSPAVAGAAAADSARARARVRRVASRAVGAAAAVAEPAARPRGRLVGARRAAPAGRPPAQPARRAPRGAPRPPVAGARPAAPGARPAVPQPSRPAAAPGSRRGR